MKAVKIPAGGVIVVEGNLSASSGFSDNISLPSGYTASNTVVLGLEVKIDDYTWRAGQNALTNYTPTRLFTSFSGNSLRVYNDYETCYGKPVRMSLFKYQ